MSASLVRRGLELLLAEDDAAASATSTASAASTASASRKGKKKAADNPVQSISKRSKKLKKLQKKQMRNQPTVKNKRVKSAVEEYIRKQNVNPYKRNLEYLLKNQCSSSEKITQKIVVQNRGRKARDKPVDTKKPVLKKSLFSDALFRIFQKEYFGK